MKSLARIFGHFLAWKYREAGLPGLLRGGRGSHPT